MDISLQCRFLRQAQDRLFDCASCDETARGSAQDDTFLFFINNCQPTRKFELPKVNVDIFLELYAVFADDGEDGEEIGEAEKFADALADVEELHLASCGTG